MSKLKDKLSNNMRMAKENQPQAPAKAAAGQAPAPKRPPEVVEKQLQSQEQELQSHEQRLQSLEQKLQSQDQKPQSSEQKPQSQEQKPQSLEQKSQGTRHVPGDVADTGTSLFPDRVWPD